MAKGAGARDMTEGSPMKLIWGFFVPMVFGLLFQQLYNMADTIIVGKCLGVQALAAVGATGSINFMIIGFCLGVCSGFAIPVAQKFGEKNDSALRRFVANSGWLAAIFSVLMTSAVCVLCRDILLWMDTPADIIDGAYRYIFVIFLGIPATYLYNLLSCTIRSLGDSTTPLIFLLFSSVLNVALDFFTILVLDMGVAGAGWATITAQAVSGLLCLLYMRKKFTILKMQGDEWKPRKDYMKILCGMGIPMGLQYSITAIGSVILQTAVNSLGSMAVAAVTAGSKIVIFLCCPFDALGSTIATYGGQNVGAGKLDRIAPGHEGLPVSGHNLRGSRPGGALPVRRSDRPPVCGPGGDRAAAQYADVPAGERPVVHPASVRQRDAFPDPGHGFFQVRDPGRRLRDDRPLLCGICAGAQVRLHRGLLCQPGGLGGGGSIPDSGLRICDETAPADVRRAERRFGIKKSGETRFWFRRTFLRCYGVL